MFPSLTGGIRFLIRKGVYFIHRVVKVSVPYRGYSFFNIYAISIHNGRYYFRKFPSLTGVIHFLIENNI